jgi:hypothetical protein
LKRRVEIALKEFVEIQVRAKSADEEQGLHFSSLFRDCVNLSLNKAQDLHEDGIKNALNVVPEISRQELTVENKREGTLTT